MQGTDSSQSANLQPADINSSQQNCSPRHFLSSLLIFNRPTHHGSRRSLSLRTGCNLRQFVGNSSLYTQQVAIVREHLGSATEQRLISALIRSWPFGSQAPSQGHRGLAKTFQ